MSFWRDLTRGYRHITLDPSPRLRALREKLEAEEHAPGRRSGAFYDVYGKDQDYRETRQQYGDRLAEDAARERDCD
jgi:hypothetical protein